MRKIRRVGRDLLLVTGTPQETRVCGDCRDHPARIKISRRAKRDGSAYSITLGTLLHLCDTCALRFVGDIIGMITHMTHSRVDSELSQTLAQRAQIERATNPGHDRRVRARLKRLDAERRA